MKQFFAAILITLTFYSCQQLSKPKAPKSGIYYGEKFDTTNAVSASQLLAGGNAGAAVVSGIITQSCQSEGCWIKLDGGDGRELFVSTENNFTVPLDGMKGQRVYAKGETFVDSTENNSAEIKMKAIGIAVK